MPRKRRNPKIRYAELPDYAVWWLENGGILNPDQCRAAGFEDPGYAAMGLFVLHYGDEPAGASPHVWTRERLRAAGYGEEVDTVEQREAEDA